MREMPPLHSAASLFPLMEGQDFDDLVHDIKTRGLIEPVWMYDDPVRGTVLLDGRNRVRACIAAGVPVRTRRYRGDDPLAFSISVNVKRRHLHVGQRAAIALRALPFFAKEATRRQREAGRYGREGGRGKKKPPPHDRDKPLRAPTSAALASKIVGISARSVEQFKLLKSVAPELAAQVESGRVKLSRAHRIARDLAAEERRRAEAASTRVRPRVEVHHGRFQDALSGLRGADAIITDPPYGEAFLPQLRDLALFADRVLKPDGVLAVMYGQTYLPQALEALGAGRPYRWTACYLGRMGWVSHPRKVSSRWKPLLIFGGCTRMLTDVIRADDDDDSARDRHHHGQSIGAFRTIIERLTSPGQLVVDPLCGGGTTLLAAKSLGRHAVGCDVDADAVARARGLLGGATRARSGRRPSATVSA